MRPISEGLPTEVSPSNFASAPVRWVPRHLRGLVREISKAADEIDVELCGAILKGKSGGVVWHEMENVHDDPAEHVKAPGGEWGSLLSSGRVVAFVHSHRSGPAAPSFNDMIGHEVTGVPWLILHDDGAFMLGGEPDPLIGRSFRHGVHDCYSLIRDYFAVHRDQTLPLVPREWEWWRDGAGDLYEEGFRDAGFREVDAIGDDGLDLAQLEVGDVLLMQIRSKVLNHGGVYVGGNELLHHAGGQDSPFDPSRLSARQPLMRWEKYVRRVIRAC